MHRRDLVGYLGQVPDGILVFQGGPEPVIHFSNSQMNQFFGCNLVERAQAARQSIVRSIQETS